MIMKYHTDDSAERIRIILAQFGEKVLGTPRLILFKFFLEKGFFNRIITIT
jgi:hypothetical protein